MFEDFTLLIVEDDKETQAMLSILFEEDFKKIYQAYNGQEGLDIFYSERPDIVLTDINMPIMNGLEMARNIKEFDDSVPVLIISAFDQRDILLEAIDIGIDSFIIKPLDVEKLLVKLEKVCMNLVRARYYEQHLKKKIQDLEQKALYDTVTGLPNRLNFEKSLDRAMAEAEQSDTIMGLFLIDLDDFKYINDNYGHPAGDEVLKSLPKYIRQSIREDDILFRIGGDEFALIVENLNTQKSIDVLKTKLSELSHFVIEYGGNTIKSSCSIGGCFYPLYSNNKAELLEYADKALYKAKNNGKANCCICEK